MKTDIIVFTDGSSLNNAAVISFGGIGVHFPNGELDDISEPFMLKPITNQRSELYAIYTAIHKITTELEFNTIMIYSDSEYSIKSLTEWIISWKANGWKNSAGKPVKNRDIIEPINQMMDKYPNRIKFKHVRSHTGKKDFESIGNDKADKLAVDGSNRCREIITEIMAKSGKPFKKTLSVDTSEVAIQEDALPKAFDKALGKVKRKRTLKVKTD
jgi:ribonuclease HI